MSLNPLIAKQKPNGSIQCLVCNLEVKPKIWTAHVNGKKHRESIGRLKMAQKRVNAPNSEQQGPPSKKLKNQEDSELSEQKGAVPSDFFDDGNGKTPFKKEELKSGGMGSSNLIEGVPAGFFDDKRLDGNVRETREKNAELDAEFARWKEEIGEEQTDQEAKKEEREAAEKREMELERIDEQMEALRKLNEMEKEKEKRMNQARERREMKKKEEEEEMEEDEEDDIDLDNIDWRAKNLFS